MQGDLFKTIIALMFAVILIVIMWSIVMYFFEMGSEEGKKEYKTLILRSITWLFLFMCAYAVLDGLRGLIGI